MRRLFFVVLAVALSVTAALADSVPTLNLTSGSLRLTPGSGAIQSIPRMAAGAGPLVFFAGRPAAEREPDAGARWVDAFLLVRLAIQNNGRVGGFIGEGAHATVS
jgi:hypothetical protein